MRKRNILSLARAILLSSMFGMSMSLPAMPTAEEIAAAEPLVQEVVKAEMDALRSGKKTREQVGDAAVAEDAEKVNHGTHTSTTLRKGLYLLGAA